VRDLTFSWPDRRGFSLSVADWHLAPRERVLLIGPSGSGKSTFLGLLCGILTPQSGSIRVVDRELTRLGAAARDRTRVDHFGIIFQMFNLLPYGSVLDNVLLPLAFSKRRRDRFGAAAMQRIEALRLLRRLGLPDAVAAARAAALSVGQQQRVAVARALIGRPEILVADAPTSALDRASQAAFLDLLFAEAEAARSAILMVSHDETLGSRFDRVIRLCDIATTRAVGSA
jgi:putative ABC transport system ATP-binding protein